MLPSWRTANEAAAPSLLPQGQLWYQGKPYPRVGLDPLRGSSVTNLTRPAERVSKFYIRRGRRSGSECKLALRRTRLSCGIFRDNMVRDNAVRLLLFALAYHLANFLCSPSLPNEIT
jgi:hypothetical protein